MILAQSHQVQLSGNKMIFPKRSIALLTFCLIYIIFSPVAEGQDTRFNTNSIVAKVRDKPITWLQLQNRYELLWQDYQTHPEEYPEVSSENFQQDLKRIALEQLIKERLYQIYAQEHNIVVNEMEIKESFKEIYAGNELFFTNGVFDERKFAEFKNRYPKRYQAISQTISNDLLNTKIEQIIKNQFNLTASQLSEIYFIQNSNIRLKYLIVSDSLMPDMFPPTPAYLNQFYELHRSNYINPEKIKIRFFFVQDKDFYSFSENTLQGVERERYQENKEEQDRAHASAYLYAKKMLQNLITGKEKVASLQSKYYPFETEFLKRGDTIGELKNSQNIVKFAYWLQPKEFFPYPIEQDNGWIIFQTIDRGRTSSSFLEESPYTVWQDYILGGRDIYFDGALQDYFEDYVKNEDIFRVNVSYINLDENLLRFPITIPQDSIISYYETHIEEFVTVRETLPLEKVQNEIKEILYEKRYKELKDSLIADVYTSVKQNNFQLDIPGATIVNDVTFIKNMPYYDAPFSLLKDKIFTTPPDSAFIIKKSPNIIIGRINSKKRFRRGELISLQPLIESLLTERWDKQWYSKFNEFYNTHKDSYRTPDTLQFRCAFIPVDTTEIKIPMSDAVDYFYIHRAQYTIPSAVRLEVIFLENSPHIEDQIQTIQKALSPPYNTDFSFLAHLFSTPKELTIRNGEFIPFSQLDESIQTVLNGMKQGDISPPIFDDKGCYIIKLVQKNEEHVPDFQEVAHQVLWDLKFQPAVSLAQKTAFTILNSVNSIDQLSAFEGDIYIFRTSYITIDSKTKTLYLTNQDNALSPSFTLTLSEDEYSLLREVKRGGIIPKIFSITPDSSLTEHNLHYNSNQGYLILFLEDKILGKKITGYESYAYAREDFSRIMQYDASREFTAYLKEEVKNGSDDIILTKIFGGWQDTGWLTLSDISSGSQIQELVLQDALQREPGTYSHPIRLTDYGFGFYYIVDKKIPDQKDFLAEKDLFQEEYIDNQFNQWFENYKQENRVEILIDI
jgi:hypothetical protein